jgi:hypothetical protein
MRILLVEYGSDCRVGSENLPFSWTDTRAHLTTDMERARRSAARVIYAELRKQGRRVNQAEAPPREEPNALRQLDKALAALDVVSDDELAVAARSLRTQDKNRLTRRLRKNVRKLQRLEANLAAQHRPTSQVAPMDAES